jgi:hypothetical protein
MSFILPCTPPKQPVYAIDNEGKEEYAEENPWVHMQFDKAEQARPLDSSRTSSCLDKARYACYSRISRIYPVAWQPPAIFWDTQVAACCPAG